jgi:5-methylcytosine-specific restriction enzyme subunit McrC
MSEPLEAVDLSPIDDLDEDDERWLSDLQRHLRVSEHVIRLGEAEQDDDYVLFREPLGAWHTGRYIGELAFAGRRLRIRPRLGEQTITEWMTGALNLVAVPDTATQRTSESFLALLMGAVWCRALDAASRHGPPAFRRDHHHEDFYIRGRLDQRRTAQLRSAGSPHVASTTRPRDLHNDVSRTLVAAERVLSQHIGQRQWHTDRVRHVLPQLVAAVGARPSLPSQEALRRLRYTPITRPFKDMAQLSWRIARQQGFTATDRPGRVEGILLDVAELWELFLLHCVRRAVPALRVEHGTTAAQDTFLLHAKDQRHRRMGRLKPDILVRDGSEVVAVIDAKYKRLQNRWPERTAGVDLGDLYQLARYFGRLDTAGRAVGALLYPEPRAEDLETSTAERHSPWLAQNGAEVHFRRVAVKQDGAVQLLQRVLADRVST